MHWFLNYFVREKAWELDFLDIVMVPNWVDSRLRSDYNVVSPTAYYCSQNNMTVAAAAGVADLYHTLAVWLSLGKKSTWLGLGKHCGFY